MTFKHKLSCRLALMRDVLPLLATVAGLTACEVPVANSDPGVSVVQVVVVPESLSLDPTQQRKFAAYGRSASGDSSTVTVTWSATGGSITPDGMFAADTTAGDFLVSATNADLKLSGSSRIRIRPRPVASVAVTPASANVVVGQTTQLNATPRDANGTTLAGRPVTWGSSNTAVAIVSAGGLVTGVAAGSVTITATSEGKSGTSGVTVILAPVASVTMSATLASVPVGQTMQLTATPRDASGNALTGRVVTWSSNNTAVATVNSSGLVTAVAVGPAIITATSEGKNGTAGVTVTLTPAAVASVSVSPVTANVTAGQTVQLTATPRDASGNALSGRVVTWGTSNAAVATVSGGVVTGVAAGGVTITATSEGQNGSSAVTVVAAPAPVASVSVSPASKSLTTGQTAQLTATPRDAGGNALTGRIVTWGSSNTAVVTVTGTGLIAGVAPGSATITATSEGRNGTAAVTVTLVPVASVSVSPGSPSVAAGQTVQLTATPRDASGNALVGRLVTWGSSNTAVATVSSTGLVAGVAAGSANITATSEGMNGVSAVTVTATSGGGTILFQETFEDNSFGSRSWYDNTGMATTTAEHIPGSTRSLEVRFTSGSMYPTWGGSARHLFNGTDAVYLSYWVKYSANWIGSGKTYHPHEFMFTTNEDDQWVGPSVTHLTTYVEDVYQNGGIPVLAMQDGSNIDQNRVGVDLTNVTENRGASGCNGNTDGYATGCYILGSEYANEKKFSAPHPYFMPTAGSGYKGDWHLVEAYFKLNSIVGGKGVPDGIAQYWFDGQLVIDKSNVLLRTGAHSNMKFNQFLIGPYIGDGSPVDQTMWVDNITVATAKP